MLQDFFIHFCDGHVCALSIVRMWSCCCDADRDKIVMQQVYDLNVFEETGHWSKLLSL